MSFRGITGSVGVLRPTASIILSSNPNGGISNYTTGKWIIFPNKSIYNRFIFSNSTAPGTIYLSGNNGIYPGARLEFSTAATAKLDLNGYDQMCYGIIGAVSASNPIKLGITEYNYIINGNSGQTSTFTISTLNGNRVFYGIIKDPINLVYNQSSGFIQTLSSCNLYTGYTAISSGTLIVNYLLISSTPIKFTGATFTKTTLSVAFALAPTIGETYTLFNGPTINTYPTVTLTGVTGGRSATYNSATSTITIT